MKNNSNILNNFFDLCNYIPTPIYWLDENNNLLIGNNVFFELTNLNPKNVIGKKMYDISIRKIKNKSDEFNQQILTKNKIKEEEFIDKNGDLKIFKTYQSKVYLNNGSIIGIIAILIDITAEKEVEQLKALNTKYRNKLNTQEILKNLINSIFFNLQKSQLTIINENKYLKNLNLANITLTKREQEVLYYLSNHKSPKEIAKILGKKENKNLSPATIASVICKQLYNKFEVNNNCSLIEKAKLLNLIPFIQDNF